MSQNTDGSDYSLESYEDNLDIKRYLSLFISNWYWFAIAMFFSLTLAYGINRYSEKIYSVSATLLIKDDQGVNLNTNVESVIPGGDIFKSRQNLKNEMGILRSFDLNYKVMKELKDFHVIYIGIGRRNIVEKKIYKDCPIIVDYDSLELLPKGVNNAVTLTFRSDSDFLIDFGKKGSSADTKKFGERIREYGFDFTVRKRSPETRTNANASINRFRFYFTSPEALANEYRGKLSVEPIDKDASIVTLSVSGSVKQQEIDYLNKLIDFYLDYGLQNKNQTADSTIHFIKGQLSKIADSLGRAEDTLKNFRLSNRMIDISKDGTILKDRLERFETEKSEFELELRYYDYLSGYLDSVKTGEIISPSVMGITDQVLIKLVNDLSSLQNFKEKLGLNIVKDQPSFGLIDKQIKEAQQALIENIRNGIAGLKLSIVESDKKIASVIAEIDKLPATEKELIKIQRNYELNNTVYNYLLEKRAESEIAKASNIPDNRAIDRASEFRSGQIRPRTNYNYIIAIMIGLILPIIAIVLIDYLNDKVIDKYDVERKTRVPIIGYISHSDSKNLLPVIEKPGSSLSESFRSVRTTIKFFIKENEKPVIAISSTISSEGKTFISINLAAITALLGKKVLLVGLDLRKPGINKVFQFDESQGMSTYLSGNCSFEDVIRETQIANLYYAPSGPIPPNPAELIETPEMRMFMERARKEFDYIIIDTPPVAIVTDALLLAPYVDLNLFIVRQRYTSRNTLELIEQLNRRGELKNLAILINDISISGYYGYGMRYGYSLGYGYSYGYNYYGKGYYNRYGYDSEAHGYYKE